MQSAYGRCTNKISNRADLSYRAAVPYVFSFSSSTEYFKREPCARADPIEKLEVTLIRARIVI